MKPNELEEYLNLYLDSSNISDYCPNGIQVEGEREIKRIATAVSANLETVTRAVDADVDALIVHHGIFWSRDPYPIVGTKRAKIEQLLKHKISLFAYHLPLDAHRTIGNNWVAAKQLEWESLEPFGAFNGTLIGVKGTFAPKSIEAFVKELETYYDHPAAVALGGKKRVNSCALISGGAYKELAEAAKVGVDCFVTGNFDEPAWGIAHEEKIHFLALGHSATERIGPQAMANHLQAELKLESLFIDVPNPF